MNNSSFCAKKQYRAVGVNHSWFSNSLSLSLSTCQLFLLTMGSWRGTVWIHSLKRDLRRPRNQTSQKTTENWLEKRYVTCKRSWKCFGETKIHRSLGRKKPLFWMKYMKKSKNPGTFWDRILTSCIGQKHWLLIMKKRLTFNKKHVPGSINSSYWGWSSHL